ncbi:MAG: bifunctional folylpolyglutamate synthase/dihydrofolate synthase [Anaerolineae bacterium]
MGRYQGALEYIYSFVSHEKRARYGADAESLGLERMDDLLERLGRPQDRFRCVHIAGTKGKGSTSAMTEAVLRAAGYRTGLYTSPHLHTFRERIRLNGALMTKGEVVELLAELRPAFDATPGINTFEIMTALAFAFFARQGVEWAVIETGLGGRLDPTNVVAPAACAITSISFDHMELLGPTLELIAREKAGIIKPGVPVVSAPQAAEALAVIEQVSAARHSPLILVGRDWTIHCRQADLDGQTVTVHQARRERGNSGRPPAWDAADLADLRIPLTGAHQLDNTAIAIALLAELRDQGAAITAEALRRGLAATRWPGRFELLNRRPDIVADCAHNGASALRLRETLARFYPATRGRRLWLVFGASADKDIEAMLRALLIPAATDAYPVPAGVVMTRSGHPRQADPGHLADLARALAPQMPVVVSDSLDEALAAVLSWAAADDVVCVTGSIFVVAQARRAWAAGHKEAFAADDWVFQDETPGQPVPDDVPEVEVTWHI